MANPTDKSVLLPLDQFNLLRQIADTEDRTLRAIVARALKMYAQKHQPAILKKAAASTARSA